MIRFDNKKNGIGLGGAYSFNALWLIVLGDDAYMAK